MIFFVTIYKALNSSTLGKKYLKCSYTRKLILVSGFKYKLYEVHFNIYMTYTIYDVHI